MFKKYDDIIIGSGISGLTVALILAQNNRSVLLLEKAPFLGGSMKRFYKEGIPFDVGFHFSGGLGENEVLSSMLSVLDINNTIKPYFFDKPGDNKIVFEKENECITVLPGIENFRKKLKSLFTEETDAIDSYFDFIQKIYNETVVLDLKNIEKLTVRFDEDYISLSDTLEKLTENKLLKAILKAYWPCYGTRPSEISYANHCRIVAAFYEKIAKVVDGGDALIEAFEKKLTDLGVDIKLNTEVDKFGEVAKRNVSGCKLTTGECVEAENYIFAINPKEIVKSLPYKYLSKGFLARVNDFESSTGFFSLYCIADESLTDCIDFYPSVITLYPDYEVNSISDGISHDRTAVIVFIDKESDNNGSKHLVFNILETSCIEDVSKWSDLSRAKKKNKDYLKYKKDRVSKILERVYMRFPELRETLKVLDSASLLTYKRFLNSYDGSAYGIKQKVGQFNLFARLPIKNIYAVGQNSVLPGIVGAMISSFMLGRLLIGEEKYNRYVERRESN